MSVLAEAQRKIEEAQVLLDKFERALCEKPDQARSLVQNIESLKKFQRQLESEFAEEAARQGVDM